MARNFQQIITFVDANTHKVGKSKSSFATLEKAIESSHEWVPWFEGQPERYEKVVSCVVIDKTTGKEQWKY